MAPSFFALDHTHYSRWVPVHIRDMTTLHERLRDVAKESTRPFAAIAIDHAHEQNNAVVKGEDGAIGLTQNPRALLRWMVAGPEIARTIDGFKTACLAGTTAGTTNTQWLNLPCKISPDWSSMQSIEVS